ncbi:MAG: hypothetical protein JO247_04180 [Chloroflexi bacterium]|nr:hypothetical protein [Chloroflexota bacterium]
MVVEAGRRRSFARAVDWPGWCRQGKDEGAALAALEACRDRYLASVAAARVLPPPGLAVVERVEGSKVTDFGAVGVVAQADLRPLVRSEKERFIALLDAAWSAFDAALAAVPARRRWTKPERGRSPGAIALHVLETEVMHAAGLTGGPYRKSASGPVEGQLTEVHERMRRWLGEMPAGKRETAIRRHGFEWTTRFVIHRSAWHALDHAWELEDRDA